MSRLRPAVFLDRDGTINAEVHYLADPADFRLLPGSGEAIRLLNRAGLLVVVVTNQSGVGRGYFSADAVEAVHRRMEESLAALDARIDAIYICPHRPEDGCDCRKPSGGMLRQAASELSIALGRSLIVGDKHSDLAAGREVGCATVLVATGYGVQEMLDIQAPPPDYCAADLLDAVRWWLNRPL